MWSFSAVAFIVFGKQTAKCKKRKHHCEMPTGWSFAKNFPAEIAIVLRLLSCQTIGFLEFLSAKFYSNYYGGRENQDNSACQALIENFVEDIDFMSSVHFRPEN